MQRIAQASRLVHKYKQACYAMAFRGSQPPEDHAQIKREHDKALDALLKVVEAGLEAKANAKTQKKESALKQIQGAR